MSRCQEANEPSTVMPCIWIRCFAAITSAGPIVAALGGTAVRSPLMPKQPCSEFCAIVNGLSVHTRGPMRFHSSKVPANSGASGSMNARCPVQPGPL